MAGEKKTQPLRIGLIGCGWISQFYGEAVKQLAGRCEWAWAADPDAEKAEKFCHRFGGEPRTSHRGASADVYIIATPHNLHMPIYLDVAATGAAVLIEKPLALTVEDCDRMIAERDKSGGLLMVGYINRYRRGPSLLKQTIERGDIGTPLFCDISQLGNQEGYAGGWILKKATLGGGCFFSSAGHLVDLLMWIHGPIERIKLETANYRLPMEGEDTALAIARFKNGLLATIRESWCANGASSWQTYTVFGTEGTLELTYNPREGVPHWHTCLWDVRLVLRRTGEPEQVLLEDSSTFEFKPQFESLLNCIETGTPPLANAESAREVIRVIREAEAAL